MSKKTKIVEPKDVTGPASSEGKRTLDKLWERFERIETIMRGQFPNDFPPDDRGIDRTDIKPAS